ncbi:response regulator [Rhodoferax aquaticus]|uniref:response regulator n=1 Tax=Rhodoferax aquaticus TaxID=2527691 RepID=UPI00143DDC2F
MGLSVTTVQKMVLRGEIAAWNTPGGHRRISVAEVKKVLNAKVPVVSPLVEAPIVSAPKLAILLVEDDPIQIQFFRSILKRCSVAVDLSVATDASIALTVLRRRRPDLVVTDLMMLPLDGFHLLNVLQSDGAAYANVDVLVLSAMDEEEARQAGPLPSWVTYYQKPINPDRMFGYLDSLNSRLLRRLSR